MSISQRNQKGGAAVATRRISDIIIGKRHRRDMGDLDALARTIRDLGLLHPVVIRPDVTLIAGERRLCAAKLLGWTGAGRAGHLLKPHAGLAPPARN